ncbi:OmpA family protein [Meridianimarinicoccus aquatilis]|uniref:OmpA-like domain-containing protein n=1 Tax=Meridianimarinicoccus aquatilis TaxID=2552766 RepID=A0A4R6B202_9RHOB|nr:OmpA family protein [Fluviibacterium aquatile]TDL90610.1 hypothetical protein E2L05_04835 [Fluviibacterium aquatile]
MRSTLQPVLRLLALGAGAGASVWVAMTAADLIEVQNRDAIAAALLRDGFRWAVVDTDGLTATLSGTAPDETARFRALRSASDEINPANIRDAMTVAPPRDVPMPDYRLEFLRAGNKVTTLGLLPGGLDAEDALLAAIADATVGLEVSSLVTASADAAPDGWSGGISTAIEATQSLPEARVVLTPGRLSVKGRTTDRATATTLEAALRDSLPDDIELALDLRIPLPTLSPFVTRLRVAGGAATFDACAASSPAGAARIKAAAVTAGLAPDSAPCTLAHGAPDAAWDRVAVDAITALHGLGSGAVTLSDLTVTLSPDAASSPSAIDAARARLEAALPDGYRLVVMVPSGTDGGPASSSAAPNFSATRSPEGQIQVRGPLPDAQAETMVDSFADARFPADSLTIALRRRSDLPEGWSLRVLAGLEAFSALESGRLSVTPAMIMLSGTTGTQGLSSTLAGRLTTALGPSAAIKLDITYREQLDPVAALPTAEECLAQVRAIQERDKITFGPGSIELDTTALSIVRRIGRVLRDCEGIAMEVGGHTDSQGRAEMNQSLSQARADAVLNALIAERVSSKSLTSVGYGEDNPVADNDTADGREANRRIDFQLQFPLLGPPAPIVEDAAASADPEIETQASEETSDGQD